MKTLIAIFALVLSFSVSASAQSKKYGVAGCGLGNVIFGKKDTQLLAATTNGTFGSQTFGITSGTSNCVDPKASRNAELFIESNKSALATDMARGEGETLANLSHVLGCEDQARFNSLLQSEYAEIFPSQDRSSAQVRDSIFSVIRSDSELVGTCRI